MLAIQNFLLANAGDLNLLEEKFAIKSKRHSKYPNLICFKYNQIESPFSEPLVQECRGIILDENDNWNVVSHSFNKFFNYGESNAVEIDWDVAEVQEKMDGCFLRNQTISVWGGGVIKIGDLVNGARPTLIGHNADGVIVPAEIIDIKNNGTKNNWVKVYLKNYTSTTASELIVTSNHHVYADGDFRPASDLKPGSQMATVRQHINPQGIHVIKSHLLGDGSITRNHKSSYFSVGHKEDHLEYVEATHKWLGLAAIKNIATLISGYGSTIKVASSITTRALNELRDEWYPNDVKTLPADLTWIDDFAIAVLYMDNGSLAHTDLQEDRAYFATNNFTEIDCNRLAQYFTTKYEVSCTVFKSKDYYSLRINAGKGKIKSIDNFWIAIAPFIVPCMRYKLPIKYRNVDYIDRQPAEVIYVSDQCTVDRIEPLKPIKKNFPSGRVGFDIQTTTGNYFASGLLVHNSLISVYNYDNKWHVQSSGLPDAGGRVHGNEQNFADLFWQTFHKYAAAIAPPIKRYSFIFEMMTPWNRIVVEHKESKLVLLGARDLETGKELHPIRAAEVLFDLTGTRFPLVKTFKLSNVSEITEYLKENDPLKMEGFVSVCYLSEGHNFPRVKIKDTKYVALHHAVTSLNHRSLLEVARANEQTEVYLAFPEVMVKLIEMRGRIDSLISDLERSYSEIKHIEIQKEFALANKARCRDALFKMRAGKVASFQEHIGNMQIDNLSELLGYVKIKEEINEFQD